MHTIHYDHVSKAFRYGLRSTTVLHELTLGIEPGEIFGFLGPNGAGKSTAIKLLLDFIRPAGGRMSVDGAVVGKDPFRHLIGYLPETPCFYENLTALETLWFAGRASGMPPGRVRERGAEVLARVDLEDVGRRPVRTYSKGMKQRLGLAMALIHDPEIFILDEPMSGLDPMGRRLVADIIRGLGADRKTIFFSSHILGDVETLCDRIGILNRGRLLFCGSVREIMDRGTNLEEVFIDLIERDERGRCG